MKKQLVKGILAATLAFATLLSAPVGVVQSVKSDNTIIATAACNHNCRHYGTSGSPYNAGRQYWSGNEKIGSYIYYVEKNRIIYKTPLYSTCVNCGKQEPMGTSTSYGSWTYTKKKQLCHA
ncbi:MAG: hypothetical protein J5753_08755 [Oscillospiraceae bacterium]|nr:hypothetical protein [Oscillospiraceae bacterium]